AAGFARDQGGQAGRRTGKIPRRETQPWGWKASESALPPARAPRIAFHVCMAPRGQFGDGGREQSWRQTMSAFGIGYALVCREQNRLRRHRAVCSRWLAVFWRCQRIHKQIGAHQKVRQASGPDYPWSREPRSRITKSPRSWGRAAWVWSTKLGTRS